MTYFLAIVSAKGGVGKTTTTINVSAALAYFGRNVIAVDTDITAPNLSIHLGVTKYPKTIHHALHNDVDILEAIYQHQSGIRIIPGSVAYDHAITAPVARMKEILPKLNGVSEIVVLDSAPGLGEEAQTTISIADGVIIVVTPDLAAVSDARKTIKLTQQLNRKILGVVVNKSHEHDELTEENVATFLEVPVLAVIPEDFVVRSAYQLKSPVIYVHPESVPAQAYKKLAGKIIGEEYHEKIDVKKQESMLHYIKEGFLH